MKKRRITLALAGAAGGAVALKFLTRPAEVLWDRVSRFVPHSDRSRFINIDGVRIHYQEFGERTAPPMVLIHGYTASVYVWHAAAPLLAGGFRVVAPDLVGFGYSQKPRGFDYSIGSQARMIKRLMDRLGIGRAHVVGSSYGGAVALTLALDHAERVDRLVLSDAVCDDQPKNHPLLRLGAFPVIGELITPFVVDSKRFLRFRMQGTLARANHHLITQERIDSIMRPLAAADAHHSVLETSRQWHAERLTRDAHLIEHPTLIIWGEDDSVIPIECGYTLLREIPRSRMMIIRNCGHVPQEERPEIFTSLVSDFARSASPARQ
jgi:pimeloyl-ACP methyl ester carboxylesterase